MAAEHTQTSVLIVDDNLGFGRVVSELLTDSGYVVLGQATTVAQALLQCDRLGPDAVLVDVNLPDGNGVALAADLLRARGALKILLTSTDPAAVSPERWRAIGATGFVPKTELIDCDWCRFLRP